MAKTKAQIAIVDHYLAQLESEADLAVKNASAAWAALVKLPHCTEANEPVLVKDNMDVRAICDYWLDRVVLIWNHISVKSQETIQNKYQFSVFQRRPIVGNSFKPGDRLIIDFKWYVGQDDQERGTVLSVQDGMVNLHTARGVMTVRLTDSPHMLRVDLDTCEVCNRPHAGHDDDTHDFKNKPIGFRPKIT